MADIRSPPAKERHGGVSIGLEKGSSKLANGQLASETIQERGPIEIGPLFGMDTLRERGFEADN